MPPKDGDFINFSQDYELDYVLGHHLARDESKDNRALLVQIGNDYKKDKKADRAKHEKPFYDYVRKHALFSKMS